MEILVIGQSLEDHINYKGETSVKPGGIFYSVLGLKSFIENDDEIFLCTSVEKEKLSLFSPYYDDINKTFFQYINTMPVVTLNISENEERHEHYSKVNQNLQIDLNNLTSFKGILINMITGFDITPEQIKQIRGAFKGPIFFDVHTLARGVDKVGKRPFRVIPNFEKWAENIDILQVNEAEFSVLFNYGNKKHVIIKLFESGIKILLITRGELGARAYYKKDEEIVSMFVPSLKVETRNRVGCGDVFGAVFFYNYIKFQDIDKALKLANVAGACAASYDNIQNFERLRTDVYERFG